MGKPGDKYRPSNGTEGCAFEEHFCWRCIHEKWMHAQKDGDAKCDILNRAFWYDLKDKEYPEEWTYDESGRPTCTAWKKWDWGKDDDGNWIDPVIPPPDDPRQLCLPFIFQEIGIKEIKEQVV